MKRLRRGGSTCCVNSCYNNSSNVQHISFFRFPKDPKRSKIWVKACGRNELEKKDPLQLYNNYKVCSKHFRNCDFLNDLRNRLQPTAYPRQCLDSESGSSHIIKEIVILENLQRIPVYDLQTISSGSILGDLLRGFSNVNSSVGSVANDMAVVLDMENPPIEVKQENLSDDFNPADVLEVVKEEYCDLETEVNKNWLELNKCENKQDENQQTYQNAQFTFVNTSYQNHIV